MSFISNRLLRKCCAALTAATLALQPVTFYGAAITPNLANIPLQGLNPVKPNVMFTLDDSNSMRFATMPDYLTPVENPGYTGAPFPTTPPYTAFSWCLGNAGDAVGCALTSPPFASSNLNHIYYNPAVTYLPAVGSDGSALPCEGTNANCDGPWTAVWKDGFNGYTGDTAVTNLLNDYPDEAFCTTATPSASDLATARTDGSVCRLNGVTYGGIGGYRYPSGSYVNRVDFRGNPYYYTIASVQFCGTHTSGWGNGTCGPRWSSSTPYVSYGAGGFDPTALTRVDISPSVSSYPSGRTYALEMANFARWYAFGRTRILAMKTATGIAFASPVLDSSTRVGFHTLNTFATAFLDVKTFTGVDKVAWFNNLYTVTTPGSTPSLSAMWRIGEYFSGNGIAAGLPTTVDPLAGEAGKCAPNYHLLATDGFWNQSFLPAFAGVAGPIGDVDGQNVPALSAPVDGFTPGQPFPPPYRGTTTPKTMADIAMYYWIHDLRPTMDDQVKDPIAPWQHVVFYGLALGTEGTLPYPSGIDDIILGTTQWPDPVSNRATATDDLWHAAVNGRGKYFNAQSAPELAEGIVSALADFTTQAGTATAVGLTGAQLTATRSFGYRTSYEIGWWGDVKKYALDSHTGALPVDGQGNPLNAPVWSAAQKVDVQTAGTGWKSPADGGQRRIVTMNDASKAPVAFQLANLSPAQAASLTAGWSTIAPLPVPTAQSVVDYLRGNKTNEGVGLSNFRVRAHTLGDFAASAAVPVGAPSQPYIDASNPGYTAFAAAKASRPPMVYVGGNDSMLHAFVDSNTADAGKEAWAYIPAALFSSGDPNDTAHTPSHKFQPGALSYRPFGLAQAIFQHQFYVNATPRVWDIDFANTNTATPPTTGNDWRSILVGGLGAGGRAVYALDVTTPITLTDTESAATNRVLWEVSANDSDFAELGYVYDAPTLVKTKRYGWVALIASGYNNATGKGVLYIVNPTNGQLLKKLSPDNAADRDPSSHAPFETASSSSPRGLSTIRAFTASRRDPYVLQAYGGDLHGNVWRFDLSDPDSANWKVALIATLKDAAGKEQPITTGVRVEIDQNTGVTRYLFVGTGKLLGKPDLDASQQPDAVVNTLYVIKDGTRTDPEPAPATPYSRSTTGMRSVNGASVTGITPSSGDRGWYQDAVDVRLPDGTTLPAKQQQIVTDVTADVQTVVAVFSAPSTDPCAPALTSGLYARDYTTGSSVLQPSTGGEPVASVFDVGAIAGVSLVQGEFSTSGSPGDVRALVTTMKGQVFSFGIQLAGAPAMKHRVSWRLINRE